MPIEFSADPAPLAHLRCPTCFYETQGDRVLQTGGARKPNVVPELASWRVFYGALSGQTGPVAGPCPACQLPLVHLNSHAPSQIWAIALPEGELTPGSPTIAPQGVLPLEQANLWMETRFGDTPVYGRSSPLGALWFIYLLVPAFLWVCAATFLLFLLFVAIGAHFLGDVIDFPFRAMVALTLTGVVFTLFQATRRR